MPLVRRMNALRLVKLRLAACRRPALLSLFGCAREGESATGVYVTYSTCPQVGIPAGPATSPLFDPAGGPTRRRSTWSPTPQPARHLHETGQCRHHRELRRGRDPARRRRAPGRSSCPISSRRPGRQRHRRQEGRLCRPALRGWRPVPRQHHGAATAQVLARRRPARKTSGARSPASASRATPTRPSIRWPIPVRARRPAGHLRAADRLPADARTNCATTRPARRA